MRPGEFPFTVVYAGAHGPYNDLETVLRAAEILESDSGLSQKVRIRLIGQGPNKAALMDRASRRGLSSVEFVDPMPREKIYEQLLNSDACLMIMRNLEVFRWGISPNKLADYLGVGRPVIFAVNSSNDPVTSHGVGVKVQPEDPKALAEAIRQLRKMSEAERASMGRHARRLAEEIHDYSNIGRKLYEVLRQCALRTDFQK
jgi:glycosyltransferase involved in cell wall biosynthesis